MPRTWIFQANPDHFDIDGYLSEAPSEGCWLVRQNKDRIAVGDAVYIWRAIGSGDRQKSGIVAKATVLKPVAIRPEDAISRKYWLSGTDAAKKQLRVVLGYLVDQNVGRFLSRDELSAHPKLKSLQVFKFHNATNFKVTDDLVPVLDRAWNSNTEAVLPDALNPRPFVRGKLYRRSTEIHDVFGGQRQGGISTPAGGKHIFLFTSGTGEKFGYSDGFRDDGIFEYTGEGQEGEMEFVRGNKAILEHAKEARELLVFKATGKGNYEYLGEFVCAGWKQTDAPDREKVRRKVIMFHLLPIEALSDETNLALSDEGGPIGHKLSIEELKRRAYAAAVPTTSSSGTAKRQVYARSKAVKDYVLERAKGECEACGNAAPFQRKNGTPYLEPHHTRRVSDGGPDHPRWVGAVCPTCHRRIHHGIDGREWNQKLEYRLGEVEVENKG